MKYLMCLITMCSFFSSALANPELCLVDFHQAGFKEELAFNDETAELQNALWVSDNKLLWQVDYNELQCKDIATLRDKIFVATMVVGVVGVVGGVCVGPIGASVAALSALTGIGLYALDYQVSKIPCKDGDTEEKIRNDAAKIVCEDIFKKGHACDPKTVRVEKAQLWQDSKNLF